MRRLAVMGLFAVSAACGSREPAPSVGAGGAGELRPPLVPDSLDVAAWRGAPLVLVLDAGHGAPDNPGNTSSFCEREQDVMHALALDVAAELEALGGFVVVPSRTGDDLVTYQERVADAARVGADAFVSLHSDVRGHTSAWSPEPGASCRASHDAPGFSVLFSDEGSPGEAAARQRLAASVALGMARAGFTPYGGSEYVGLYEPSGPAGAFVDRHADDKRIFVLRRTRMPAVIVETHNALDPVEAEAWEEPLVREAFARALALGVRAAVGDG